jgi:hypothetical protein
MKVLLFSFLLTVSPAFAQGAKAKAHEHGVATVSVAIDKNMLLIGAEIPAEAVFGLERKPKTDAEKKKVEEASAVLKDKVETLFELPADLECKVTDVKLSDNLTDDDHADVDVDYTFTCGKTAAGSTLKLGLLKVFPKIKKVKVQVLSDATQSGQDVTSAQDAVKL